VVPGHGVEEADMAHPASASASNSSGAPLAPSAQLVAASAAPTPLILTGLLRAIKQHEKETKQHAKIPEEVPEAEVAQAPPHVYRTTPGGPAAEEGRIHALTRVPLLNWCSACVDGLLRDRKHAKTERRQGGDADRAARHM
jgi:hypothetical protein